MDRSPIRHVTLNTGHQRLSFRDELPDTMVRDHLPVLLKAAAGEMAALPGRRELAISGTLDGPCFTLRLWPVGNEDSQGARDAFVGSLLTAILAPDTRSVRAPWERLHDPGLAIQLATSADCAPEGPCCAIRVDPGSGLFPEAVPWVDLFCRAAARAWLQGAGILDAAGLRDARSEPRLPIRVSS